MTSIREAIARLLARIGGEEPDEPAPFQAYTFYWTKEARAWSSEKRAAVSSELEVLISQAGFEANPYERRYSVPDVDRSKHSGASLIALKRVLNALSEFHDDNDEERE